MVSMLSRKRRPVGQRAKLSLEIASTPSEVEETQRLRYRIFADEMGAKMGTLIEGLDVDRYDRFCNHLYVRDHESGEIVACTRLLTDTQARAAGGFYSQSEFDLYPILALPGRVMEMGRTCVKSTHRSGVAVSLLWSGLGNFIVQNRFDYLIGCASISMRDGSALVHSTMEQLRDDYMADPQLRAIPKHALAPVDYPLPTLQQPPSLIRAYLRWGARVCGEPCWDPSFNVADLLMLLNLNRADTRFLRRYSVPVGYRSKTRLYNVNA